jgi:hypothetical protein
MLGAVIGLEGRERGLGAYADFTDRIAAGELPPVPPRPKGVERNVVVTLWDVSTPTAFVHDVSTTDKRNPTMNGYGKVYGVEFHNNALVELDPINNTSKLLQIPTRNDKKLMTPFTRQQVGLPFSAVSIDGGLNAPGSDDFARSAGGEDTGPLAGLKGFF